MRYLPAGLSALIEPAGEMWSVVMLSPSTASTRAPCMGASGAGCARHAVEVRRVLDVGAVAPPTRRGRPRGPSSDCHCGVAREDVGVDALEHRRGRRVFAIASATSCCVGQMSFRKTGLPSLPVPSGSVVQVDVDACRRARTRRRAAATRGSSRAPRRGRGPRSCGCPRAPTTTTRSFSSIAFEIGRRERPAVADARRAAVADEVEAELLEVR